MPRSQIFAILLAIASMPVLAQESVEVDQSNSAQTQPLPDPLTLEDALRFARNDHPSISRYEADHAIAMSGVELAESRFDVTASITLDARAVDKVVEPGHRLRDDSRAIFYLSKLLSDFGEGRATVAAAEARRAGTEIALDYRTALHDLDIMRRFFEVKLSDLRYFVDDEDMTLAFLRYDRVRERRELFSEFAEVEEKELETVFRDRLVTRTEAANDQRLTRNRLALAMGRPGELPDRVLEPELNAYDRDVPDYDELLEDVLASHPLMKVSGVLVEAADHAIRALEAADHPELRAQFEATEWSLEVGNRDQYIAGLALEFPLGGRTANRARLAQAMAERDRLVADRRALEYELRQEVLELVQKLRALTFEMEAASVNERYRDLYLDRSRTMYQLEVRSDLGDSQARQAEAVWRSAKAEFDRALIWAQIDAMRGMPLAVFDSEEPQ